MPTYPLQFPNLRYTYSTFSRPKFKTTVQEATSGRTIRTALWALPLWEFELTFDILADMGQNQEPLWQNDPYQEFQELSQLFLSCYGQLGTFLFTEPFDHSRNQVGLGIGDGVNGTFLANRQWGFGDNAFIEPVGAVKTVNQIYYNTVPVGFAPPFCTTVGNQIVLSPAPAPGVVVTADFEFQYLCRWMEDLAEYEQWMTGLWTQRKCHFIQVRS